MRRTNVSEEIEFQQVVPIVRIFDVPRAEEFYLGFLGFTVDWDHRFDANAPLYRQFRATGSFCTSANTTVTVRPVHGSVS
jgi:hypothetical protein